MFKRMSLTHFLSRSPRRENAAVETASGDALMEVKVVACKKKNKSSLFQTLKKKISGTFDSRESSIKSTVSREFHDGLSNSNGETFSQVNSDEYSSDSVNITGSQKSKRASKRSIRPINCFVARNDSIDHADLDRINLDHAHTFRNSISTVEYATSDLQNPKNIEEFTSESMQQFYETQHYVLQTENIFSTNGDTVIDQVCDQGEIGNMQEIPLRKENTGNYCISEGTEIVEDILPIPRSLTNSESSLKLQVADRNNTSGNPKHSLAEELDSLAKFGWYWGPITRIEAEEKLSGQPDGSFLVRDSSDVMSLLSLSFNSNAKTLHTRIEHFNGWYSFYPHPEHEGHRSLVNLIEHCMNHSESGVFCYSRSRVPGFPPFPVRLTNPVSRFTQVRTLQYLCRFVIRQFTRVDHIQALPLPSSIKGYVEERHY